MAAITDLTTLTHTDLAASDWLVVHDLSAATDKKIAPFVTGTWTPQLLFGYNGSGITYTTQSGQYTRIGNMLWVTGVIVLTSKGTATGLATIAGLPVAVAGISSTLSCLSFSLGASVSATSALAVTGGSSINLYYTPAAGAATYSQMTNTEFGNSSILYFSGVYKV